MGVFSSLFSKKKIVSTVLIDIGATSVAGACALFVEGDTPTILFTSRLKIEPKAGEGAKHAMLRTLESLMHTLVRDGAPAVHRAVGSGAVHNIYVSIDAPWEKTELRTIQLEHHESIAFTEALVESALEHHREETPADTILEEHVVGITLNGYPTEKPFGHSTHRASLIVLSSRIGYTVSDEVAALLKAAYHTHHVAFISGTALRLQSLRALFPHEKEALSIDTNGISASVALLRDGLLAGLAIPAPAQSWTESVGTELEKIAQQFPLPRTVLLLAREDASAPTTCEFLRTELKTFAAGKLWSPETPPKIIPILPKHCSGLVQYKALTPPDLSLTLMASYWGSRVHEKN